MPEPTNGDELADRAQWFFESLPRIKYDELPDKLKKRIRDTISPDKLCAFLKEGYTAEEYSDLTADIKPRTLDTLLIRTRNSAVYTITSEKGNLKFSLYGYLASEAFETVLSEYRKKLGQNTRQTRARRKTDKLTKYALGGSHQWVISDKRYSHALTTQRNEHAYIALMPSDDEFIKKFSFQDGILTYDDKIAAIIKKQSKGKYEDMQQLDLPVLIQIYTAAIKTELHRTGHSITVSIPRFFKEMGIDIQTGNAADALTKIQQFEKCWAVMPQRGLVFLLIHIAGFDLKKQEMIIDVPYFYKLREVLLEENTETHKLKGGTSYTKITPHHNMLIHSTIASERNKTAVEVVYYITNALLQRGFIPDSDTYQRKNKANNADHTTVTFSVSYRTIINECQFFRARLQSSPNKNVVLKRTFEKALQLLQTQTDINQYFVDLKTRGIVPTMKSLDDDLIITHHGQNTAYHPEN